MADRRDSIFAVLFWLLVGTAGLAVVQMATGQIGLYAYDYGPGPWPFSHIVAGGIVVIGAIVLALREMFLRQRDALSDRARQAGEAPSASPAARLRAATPLAAVVALGVYQALAVRWFFIFIPMAMVAVGWAVGRLAAIGAMSAPRAAPAINVDSRAVPRGGRPISWFTFVVGAAILAAAVWIVQLQREYATAHLGAPDIGLFATRLVNTLAGRHPFSDNSATPPFADHFNPAFYVLAPLALFPDPVAMLNLVQCAALAAPALIWYLVARRAGYAPHVAALAAVAWLFVPSVSQLTYNMSYGFHPISIAAVAMAGSLYFATERRWLAFAICAILACALRETLAISYAGVGLWLLASKDTRKSGAIVTGSAVAYFAIVVWIVLPAVTGGQAYVGPSRFGHLGDNALQILLSPILRPGAFFTTMFSAESLLFVATLFAAVAFLPIRAGRALLMLLPEGLLLLLWKDPNVRNIGYQYQTIVVVQLYWLALNTPQWLQERCAARSPQEGAGASAPKKDRTYVAAWTLFGAALTGSLLLGRWPVSTPNTPFDQELPRPYLADFVRRNRAAVANGVASTPRAADYCVRTAEMFILPHEVPPDAMPPAYILDWGDDWMRHDFTVSFPFLHTLQERLERAGYLLFDTQDEMAIFTRGIEPLRPPPGNIFVDRLPDDLDARVSIPVTRQLTLIGWKIEKTQVLRQRQYLTVACYLAVSATPPTDLGFSIRVYHRDWPGVPAGFSYFRPAGEFRAPSSTWPAGAIVCERATIPWLILDPPQKPLLSVTLSTCDLTTGEPVYPPGGRAKAKP